MIDIFFSYGSLTKNKPNNLQYDKSQSHGVPSMAPNNMDFVIRVSECIPPSVFV